jgi:predicted nucleic acid-binding protein
MRILIDTNILIDFIVKRQPFSDDAEKVIDICMSDNFNSCIAAHSIPNIHYILRKHLTKEQRKNILLEICSMFVVVGIDVIKLVSALENDDFSDYEDCLQLECAKEFNTDYIVTRNPSDFNKSSVPAIEPSDFISKYIDISEESTSSSQ